MIPGPSSSSTTSSTSEAAAASSSKARARPCSTFRAEGKRAQQTTAESAGVSLRRVESARAVLRYSRELAEHVRDSVLSLDEALERRENSGAGPGDGDRARSRTVESGKLAAPAVT